MTWQPVLPEDGALAPTHIGALRYSGLTFRPICAGFPKDRFGRRTSRVVRIITGPCYAELERSNLGVVEGLGSSDNWPGSQNGVY
jgi:hypothetical protein